MKLVLVTGSGRSGTSSVAGTLKRLGLHIPQPEVETDESNPRGYYEPLWVAEFHKWLLNPIPVRTIDSRPNAGKIAKKHVTPEVEEQLRDWLREQLDLGHSQILLKDTRAYWVYDLWQRMAAEFGAELTCLTMLRHPAEVVRSRDTAYLADMDRQFRRQRETTNVAAWINAAFETERVTRGNPRAFVRYPDLIADWRAAMTAGRQAAGADLRRRPDAGAPPGRRLHRRRAQPLAAPTGTASRSARRCVDLADRSWDAMNALVDSPTTRRRSPRRAAARGVRRASTTSPPRSRSTRRTAQVAPTVTQASCRRTHARRARRPRLGQARRRLQRVAARCVASLLPGRGDRVVVAEEPGRPSRRAAISRNPWSWWSPRQKKSCSRSQHLAQLAARRRGWLRLTKRCRPRRRTPCR